MLLFAQISVIFLLVVTFAKALTLPHLCKSKSFGYKIQDPDDCHSFYVCLGNWGQYNLDCGWGYRFDEIQQKCIKGKCPPCPCQKNSLENEIETNGYVPAVPMVWLLKANDSLTETKIVSAEDKLNGETFNGTSVGIKQKVMNTSNGLPNGIYNILGDNSNTTKSSNQNENNFLLVFSPLSMNKTAKALWGRATNFELINLPNLSELSNEVSSNLEYFTEFTTPLSEIEITTEYPRIGISKNNLDTTKKISTLSESIEHTTDVLNEITLADLTTELSKEVLTEETTTVVGTISPFLYTIPALALQAKFTTQPPAESTEQSITTADLNTESSAENILNDIPTDLTHESINLLQEESLKQMNELTGDITRVTTFTASITEAPFQTTDEKLTTYKTPELTNTSNTVAKDEFITQMAELTNETKAKAILSITIEMLTKSTTELPKDYTTMPPNKIESTKQITEFPNESVTLSTPYISAEKFIDFTGTEILTQFTTEMPSTTSESITQTIELPIETTMSTNGQMITESSSEILRESTTQTATVTEMPTETETTSATTLTTVTEISTGPTSPTMYTTWQISTELSSEIWTESTTEMPKETTTMPQTTSETITETSVETTAAITTPVTKMPTETTTATILTTVTEISTGPTLSIITDPTTQLPQTITQTTIQTKELTIQTTMSTTMQITTELSSEVWTESTTEVPKETTTTNERITETTETSIDTTLTTTGQTVTETNSEIPKESTTITPTMTAIFSTITEMSSQTITQSSSIISPTEFPNKTTTATSPEITTSSASIVTNPHSQTASTTTNILTTITEPTTDSTSLLTTTDITELTSVITQTYTPMTETAAPTTSGSLTKTITEVPAETTSPSVTETTQHTSESTNKPSTIISSTTIILCTTNRSETTSTICTTTKTTPTTTTLLATTTSSTIIPATTTCSGITTTSCKPQTTTTVKCPITTTIILTTKPLTVCNMQQQQQYTTTTTNRKEINQDINAICAHHTGIFFIKDSKHCNKYYSCYRKHAYSQVCPGQFYFDDKLKMCNYPQLVDCKKSVINKSNLKRKTQLSSEKSKPHSLNLVPDDCRTLKSGTFIRDSNNCNKYYVCVNGYAVALYCPRGQYFDIEGYVCNFKALVKNCSV